MPYLGRTVVTNLADYHVDSYTHVGSSPSSSQFIAGTTSALTLTNTGVEDEQALSVYFNGVHQQHNTYTITNSVVTFDAAIPTGTDKVEIHYGTQPVTSGLAADSVGASQIAVNSVAGTKIAMGSDAAGDILYYNGTDYVRLGKGTSGHFLKIGASAPSWASAGGLTIAAEQATTSGSSITFGSIPAGTSRIHIMFEGFSTGGANTCGIQLGDASGIESSGYLGGYIRVALTASVQSTSQMSFSLGTGASYLLNGVITLVLKKSSDYTWTASGNLSDSSGNDQISVMACSKALSAELTQVKVLTDGTFSAGSVSISYD